MVLIVKIIVKIIKLMIFGIKVKNSPFSFLLDDFEDMLASQFETTTAAETELTEDV